MYFVVLKRNSAGFTTENKDFIQHKPVLLFSDCGSIFCSIRKRSVRYIDRTSITGFREKPGTGTQPYVFASLI